MCQQENQLLLDHSKQFHQKQQRKGATTKSTHTTKDLANFPSRPTPTHPIPWVYFQLKGEEEVSQVLGCVDLLFLHRFLLDLSFL